MNKSLHFESLEQRCLLAANLIADLNTVAGGFYRPRDAVQGGDLAYVRAEDVDYGYAGLWVTDGTERGLEVIHFGGARDLSNLNGQLLFADDELYTSDGTPEGTVVVKDIRAGEEASSPRDFTMASDQLFFIADDGSFNDQLWVSDGTEGGTLKLHDFTSQIICFDAQPLDDRLVFWNPVVGSGYELWVSDGSATGTLSLASFEGSSELGVVGEHVYFMQPDGLSSTT
jgi:ELWxxDGT repeat protein